MSNQPPTAALPANEPKFRPGDRVVHITASEVPEGAKGTVLQKAPDRWSATRWEVEYDDHPCDSQGRPNSHPWAKSTTSWISRETSIELTREEILKRIANG